MAQVQVCDSMVQWWSTTVHDEAMMTAKFTGTFMDGVVEARCYTVDVGQIDREHIMPHINACTLEVRIAQNTFMTSGHCLHNSCSRRG